mmetsp:Transcript_11613/g.24705  ORF Transcript_11613/g.24705 Transcript_11613/m.24705 type:complete len:149 (+) Transcript_11613:44-490(+)
MRLLIFFYPLCLVLLERAGQHPLFASKSWESEVFLGLAVLASTLNIVLCFFSGRDYQLEDGTAFWKWQPPTISRNLVCLFSPLQIMLTLGRPALSVWFPIDAPLATLLATWQGVLAIMLCWRFDSREKATKFLFDGVYAAERDFKKRE